MSLREAIETKLSAALSPLHLVVVDESSGHGVAKGAESHFLAYVVSDKFAGTSRVMRHRMVHDLLGEELRERVHAFTLRAHTPDEWRAVGSPDIDPEFASPACKGGSKAGP